MIRLFRTHRIRKTTELEGFWDFVPCGDEPAAREGEQARRGEGSGDASASLTRAPQEAGAVAAESGKPAEKPGSRAVPARFTHRLPVPGCWESHPDFSTYRGTGWYRTSFTLDGPTALRITFEGVSHTGEVYLDGQFLTRHYNAYTPFTAFARDVQAGRHELAVWVDNRFTPDSSLHIPNDYYTYGGITRPVALEEVGGLLVERTAFTPQFKNGQWSAAIRTVVRNLTDEPRQVSLTGKLAEADGPAQSPLPQARTFPLGGGVAAPGGITEFCVEVDFPGVAAWSCGQPNLYLLETRLYAGAPGRPDPEQPALDDLIERVGFRTVTIEDGRLRLNGGEIFLRGFCRHEDHPQVGCAIPPQLMAVDLDLIQDMQANAVRTTHYPYDQRFLDLCDERGLLVWEENHARGLELERMEHPLFDAQCEAVNREMVENHFNHPGIIIWGLLNECASHTDIGRAKYAKQIRQIRGMDGSRPVTFASNHPGDDRCLDLVDLVSFNVYPGWYNDEDPGELSDRLRAWADEAGGRGKPMILSEFGGDGYYGFRSRTRVRGSEERHAEIVDRDLSAFLGKPYVQGAFIWQFSDCRVTEGTGWLLSRACTRNSKGIVDEYRRPKLAYDVVRDHYGRKAD